MRLKRVTLETKIDRTLFALAFLVLSGVSLLTLLPLVDAAPSASAADDETPTITISTGNDTALVTVAPDSATGTFATSSSSDITFGVSTNSICGYTLSVSTGNSSSVLSNGEYTITSITSPVTAADFNTSTYNNRWGFKPNKYIDTSTNTVIDNTGEDAVFLPAPVSGRNIDKTSAPNSVDNEYSIAIGMRVNLDTVAGEYNNSLVILSVANPIVYNINFDTNAPEGTEISDFPNILGGSTQNTSIELPSNTPQREHYTFIGWCDIAPTNTNDVDACTGTHTNGAAAVSYQPGDSYTISHVVANTATLYAMWQIDAFTQTTRYRYENANGSFGEWVTAEEVVLNYGESYSWNQDDVADFDARIFEDNGVAEYIVEDNNTNDITFMRQYYTCNKYYKKQKADGTYEDPVFDGSEQIKKGNWCVYTKSGENGYEAMRKESMSIDYPDVFDLTIEYNRRKFTITFNKQGDVTDVEGGGTYRWGEVVELTAVKPENSSCRTYSNTEWWTNDAPGGFVEANGAAHISNRDVVHYEVGIGNALIGVLASHTDHKQTIHFSAPNGETITFDGVDYQDGGSTQAYCGTYDISTTLIEQPEENRIYLQDITPATCPTTKTRVYDRRDEESYYIQKLADGNCWLLDNLRLDSATSVPLTTANTHMSPVYNFTLPETWPINSGYSYETLMLPRITTYHKNVGLAPWWVADAGTFSGSEYLLNARYTVENNATIAFAEVSRTGVYYNYCAATAGTWCKDHDGVDPEGFVDDGSGTIYDLCPAGWRIPTGGAHFGEYATLQAAYNDVEDFKDALNVRLGSGMVNGVNTQWNQRSIGYYWSGTPYMHVYAYYLATWRDGGVNDGFNDRDVGLAMRCMMEIPNEP